MLLLSSLKDSPLPQMVTFPDHLDTHALYYLPADVVLAETTTGEKDFFLLRYHGDFTTTAGGLLHLRLALKPLAEAQLTATKGWQVHPVSFQVGQFRLRLKSMHGGATDQHSDWHEVTLVGRDIVTSATSLTPHETQALSTLLEEGASVVEVEVDLRYRGLVSGLPWLVTAHTDTLKTQLASLLGKDPVRPDQIIAAFLSLPASDGQNGVLSWRALEAGAAESTRETLMTEVALRSLDVFFQREAGGSALDVPRYRLRPLVSDDPITFSWDLQTYRQEERRLTYTWSVSELYRTLTNAAERQKFFPAITQVSPFGEAHIYVTNSLPISPDALRSLQVDLRFPGPTGVLEEHSLTFKENTALQQLSTIYPAITETFQVEYRITAIIAALQGGWPRVWIRDFAVATSPLIEISRKVVGIDFVRVEVEAQTFAKAASLDLSILTATEEKVTPGNNTAAQPSTPVPLARLTLTAARSSAWIALPGNDPESALRVLCTAYSLEGTYSLLNGPLIDRRVEIYAYQMEPQEPDYVTLLLDAETASHFAYVGVSLAPTTAPESDEGKLYTLHPDEPRKWPFFRPSVFAPLRFRYRITYVAYDASGNTLPMTATDWSVMEGTLLNVRPPVSSSGIQP